MKALAPALQVPTTALYGPPGCRGVVYTYGPGMTFRGSVGCVTVPMKLPQGADNVNATDVLLGTQINF